MSSYSIQMLVNDFSSYRTELQAHSPNARSHFFLKCAHYYEAHAKMPSCLDSDAYLRKAENLSAIFGHAPGSMARLIPLKTLYIYRWADLKTLLTNYVNTETELHEKVMNLVITHKHFAIQFANEVKTNLIDTPESAELNNAQTLPLLYKTAMHIIIECPEKLEEIRSLVSESDPSLFDFIPYQTILNLISTSQQTIPSEDIAKEESRAELLLPIVAKMKNWREHYEQLSETDRMSLARVKGSVLEHDKKLEEDLTSTLSTEGKKLFLESCAGVYECQDKNSVSFSALASRLFSFILTDCTRACNLTHVVAFDDSSRNLSAKEALQLLKSLPVKDYTSLRSVKRFSFLPDCQNDLNSSHCNHWAFYRIHSILMLAVALKEICERGDSNPQEENLTTTSK